MMTTDLHKTAREPERLDGGETVQRCDGELSDILILGWTDVDGRTCLEYVERGTVKTIRRRGIVMQAFEQNWMVIEEDD